MSFFKTNNRLLADTLRTFFSGVNDTAIAAITTSSTTTLLQVATTIDTVSTDSASAVVFYVNALKDNESHFAIVSATKTGSADCDYSEFGTIITDAALASYTVDINSDEFRLRATPATTGVTFKVTKVVVPA